jgi:hypothetical protein
MTITMTMSIYKRNNDQSFGAFLMAATIIATFSGGTPSSTRLIIDTNTFLSTPHFR